VSVCEAASLEAELLRGKGDPKTLYLKVAGIFFAIPDPPHMGSEPKKEPRLEGDPLLEPDPLPVDPVEEPMSRKPQ